MAKQFALHQVLRQRAAIDRHQRPGSPRAALVDRPGHQLLAGAGLASDEHVCVTRRHAGDQPPHPVEAGRRAHELARPLGPTNPAFKRPHSARQFPFLPHPLEDGLDLGQFARLGEVVEDSLPDRRHRALERRLPGDDHRLRVGRRLPHACNHVQPAHTGHVEIDDHAVVGGAVECGQRCATVGTDRRLVAQPWQFDPHQFLDRGLVVGKQDSHRPDVLFHGKPPNER